MRKGIAGLIAAAMVLGVGSSPAYADGLGDQSSCVGTLSVFNQQNPEVFGSRSDVALAFIALANQLGITPGAIYTIFADAHGSVAFCLTIP